MGTDLDVFFLYILEPSSLHGFPLCSIRNNREAAAGLASTFDEHRAPLTHGALFCNGIVVAFPRGAYFVALKPTTRLQTSKRSLEQNVPVVDASNKAADVDQVKMVGRESPFLGTILHLAL